MVLSELSTGRASALTVRQCLGHNPIVATIFGAVLRELRIENGLSQNALARRAGIDPAYVNRLERAPAQSTNLPSRRVVLDLAEAMELGPVGRERLLVAANLCPESIARLGEWDQTLGDVAGVLANPRLSHDDRVEFRELIRIMAHRWGRSAASS
jgi:transcriptional regulator with XRE-family HTH domain